MEEERRESASATARTGRLFSVESWSGVSGLAAGAILTKTLSGYGYIGVVIGAVTGGVIGFGLTYSVNWCAAYLRYPRLQLEMRVAQLEARPSNIVAATDRPAPNFRPEIRVANEMLALPHGDQAAVTEWIDNVYERLFEWNIAIALAFRPDQMVATQESVTSQEQWRTNPGARPPLGSILASLGTERLNLPPPLEFDPELVRLRTHRDRLLELVPQ